MHPRVRYARGSAHPGHANDAHMTDRTVADLSQTRINSNNGMIRDVFARYSVNTGATAAIAGWVASRSFASPNEPRAGTQSRWGRSLPTTQQPAGHDIGHGGMRLACGDAGTGLADSETGVATVLDVVGGQ